MYDRGAGSLATSHGPALPFFQRRRDVYGPESEVEERGKGRKLEKGISENLDRRRVNHLDRFQLSTNQPRTVCDRSVNLAQCGGNCCDREPKEVGPSSFNAHLYLSEDEQQQFQGWLIEPVLSGQTAMFANKAFETLKTKG